MSRSNLLPIVDSHHHFWDLKKNYYPWLSDRPLVEHRYGDYSPIATTYLPQDYREDARRHTIVHTVHVQADWDPSDPVGETRWLEGLSRTEGLPSACVVHAALDTPDVGAILSAQAGHALVRGIRHKPAAAASARQAVRNAAGSMDDPLWRRGYEMLARHRLSFDLQTPWWHLDAAYDLALDFPDTPIIVNHAALPGSRDPDVLELWRRSLGTAVRAENISIKISGLGIPGRPWSAEDNGSVIRDIIAIFGAERCLFGSNFPVDKLT